jgi:DNA-directed RNA polymerase subunit RPC12/RpoP
MSTFFKKCPSCGKRFEVKHTGEELAKSEVKTEDVNVNLSLNTPFQWSHEASTDTIDVEPGALGPIAQGKRTIEKQEDTYTEDYQCKHCGYRWKEERVKGKHVD